MSLESSLLSLLWIVYFLLHSFLASLAFKQWVAMRYSSITPYYRLGYNSFATLSLLPLLALMMIWRGPLIIQWNGLASYVMNGVALFALVMFVHSTRFYDMAEFFGTRQIIQKEHDTQDKAAMCMSPYHRFVRHPWYSFALVLIWTREMDQMQLLSSLAMTVYFILGSHLEEKKLIVNYGEQYRTYQKKVPGLIPLPWKFLKRSDIQ